jgi:hypothetical protein
MAINFGQAINLGGNQILNAVIQNLSTAPSSPVKGLEYYVEAQFGSFRREFHQPGSENLSGKGFAANLIYGQQLSPHFGVDIALTAKRISSGTLDKRWIVDLLPLLSVRGDF